MFTFLVLDLILVPHDSELAPLQPLGSHHLPWSINGEDCAGSGYRGDMGMDSDMDGEMNKWYDLPEAFGVATFT